MMWTQLANAHPYFTQTTLGSAVPAAARHNRRRWKWKSINSEKIFRDLFLDRGAHLFNNKKKVQF